MSLSRRRHVVAMSLSRRRHVVAMSLSRRRHVVAMSLSRRRHVVAIYLMFDLKSSGKNSLERPIKSLRNCRSRMSAFDIPNSSMHST
jgi:hypothetical protein